MKAVCGTGCSSGFQYLLPQHGLLAAGAGRDPGCARAWFKDWLIRGFLKLYRIDMSEAGRKPIRMLSAASTSSSPGPFEGQRRAPIAHRNESIACPVDGLRQRGGDHRGRQAAAGQGPPLRTHAKLLADQPWAGEFEGGFLCDDLSRALQLSPAFHIGRFRVN